MPIPASFTKSSKKKSFQHIFLSLVPCLICKVLKIFVCVCFEKVIVPSCQLLLHHLLVWSHSWICGITLNFTTANCDIIKGWDFSYFLKQKVKLRYLREISSSHIWKAVVRKYGKWLISWFTLVYCRYFVSYNFTVSVNFSAMTISLAEMSMLYHLFIYSCSSRLRMWIYINAWIYLLKG